MEERSSKTPIGRQNGIFLVSFFKRERKKHHRHLRGEWLSGLNSLRQVTELKLGGMTSNSGYVTSEAFGRDSKLGVPCLDAACTVGLNYL